MKEHPNFLSNYDSAIYAAYRYWLENSRETHVQSFYRDWMPTNHCQSFYSQITDEHGYYFDTIEDKIAFILRWT